MGPCTVKHVTTLTKSLGTRLRALGWAFARRRENIVDQENSKQC